MRLRTLICLGIYWMLTACTSPSSEPETEDEESSAALGRPGVLPSTVQAYDILDRKAAQTYENPIEIADSLRGEYRFPEAVELYNQVLEKYPENYEALWKKSTAVSEMGFLIANPGIKEDYYTEALHLAKHALGIHPDQIGSHFAMALALARMENVVEDHRKITFAIKMKRHVEEVLRLDSTYHYAWYLLGSWSYDFAGLNDSDHSVAQSLFGTDVVNNATYEHAVDYFKKALSHDPDNVVYNYHAAMAYIQTGQEDVALDFLRKAVHEPINAEKEEEFIRKFNLMITGHSD
ncbi:MAG: tetratricopeptide repeat protein [Bacteroidota bacterium]